MSREVSLMISAKDNYSQAISKMAATTRSFEKDMAGLGAKLTQLNNNKAQLKIDAAKAKAELKEAREKFKATGDAADELQLKAKQMDFDNITDNLKLVSDQAKNAQKDMRGLTDELSRQQNRADGGGSGASGAVSALASSGLKKMLGDSLSNVSGALAGSALGDAAGSAVMSTLSSAATGAAIGSVIPGIGTAVGALGGAVVGMINGAVDIFTKKDDTFKSVVQKSYEDVTSSLATSLTSGSEIAAYRETLQLSYRTLVGEDSQADALLQDIKKYADLTPYGYATLADMGKNLVAYGYSSDKVLGVIESIGSAGAAVGVSDEGLSTMVDVIGRMNEGEMSAQQLRRLTYIGLNPYKALASQYNDENGTQLGATDIRQMSSDGAIDAKWAAQALLNYYSENYGDAFESFSQTFSGLSNTLEDYQDNLNAAMGEGYNAERKEGLSAQIDWLSGEEGEKMQDAYTMIGQWKADLDNLQEQYARDAMTAVMGGELGSMAGTESEGRLAEMAEQYKVLMGEKAAGNEEAGAEMGRLLAEAQVIAANEYIASEGYQLELESQLALIQSLQSDASLNSNYWDAGYELGQQFSKGRASATSAPDWAASWSGGQLAASNAKFGMTTEKSNAWGQQRVPYDNYPALLHEGEKVLTAQEARNGGTPSVTVNVGELVVREEDDVEKIAQTLAREIALAKTVAV